MTSKIVFPLALAAGFVLAGPAGSDVWDTAAFNDNGNNTHSQLTHGFSAFSRDRSRIKTGT
jgi:hypothetical protein